MNDEISKMFKYMMDMDKRIQEQPIEVRQDIANLRSAPDDGAKYISDNDAEQAVRDIQFDRLLEWGTQSV